MKRPLADFLAGNYLRSFKHGGLLYFQITIMMCVKTEVRNIKYRAKYLNRNYTPTGSCFQLCYMWKRGCMRPHSISEDPRCCWQD